MFSNKTNGGQEFVDPLVKLLFSRIYSFPSHFWGRRLHPLPIEYGKSMSLLWTQCISLIIAFGLDHIICIGQRDIATHDLSLGICNHVWAFSVVFQPFHLEKMPPVATSPRKMRDTWRRFEIKPQLEPYLHYIGQIPADTQICEQDININITWHWDLRGCKSIIIIVIISMS